MILVFGKTGQVGRELQKLEGIFSLDRTQADLTDSSACMEAIIEYKPSAVINAAAYTAVDKAEEQEEIANLINGETPGAMAKACFDLKIPFVHISTDYVFDGTGDSAWQTTDFTSPQNAYGRSKLKGEEAIMAYGGTYVILRTSWVFSAYGDNFLKTMLRLSGIRKTLGVVGDQIGGPTSACDIAKACREIAQQLIESPEKSGIFHFSGLPDTSWCEFANSIFKHAGKKTSARPIATSEYPTLASRPLNSRLDCGLTKSTFGISQPNWLVGLNNVLRDLEINHETA